MRNHLFLRRAGEGVVSRWAALGMIVAVLALVMTSFAFVPVASADEIGTSTTTSPTTTKPTTKPPVTTADAPPAITTAPRTSTSEAEAPEPEAPITEKPTLTTTAPTTTAPAAAQRLAAGGVNPGIDVKITDIQLEGKNGQQITVGDSVEVKGTWDASNAAPQPGDQFTIQFPDELKLDANPTIPLEGDDGTVWGTCALVAATNLMTCVLSDAVTDRPDEVKGDFFVYTKAVGYTTSETVDFTINDTVTPVDLPGSGGISDGRAIGEATKSGKLADNKQAVRWTIDIPGADLAALDAAGTGSATLSDALSANMKLCEDGRVNAKLLAGRPGDLAEVPGVVAVTQSAAGEPVSIVINNGAPFANDKLYRVEYTSCTTSGVVDLPTEGDESVVYDNSVTIGGNTVDAVGVGQTWRPKTGPEKSGNLDRDKRYMEAAWTILIPGNIIADSPDSTVTIAETLGGLHSVCESGLQLKIERAHRLPAPDGSGYASTDVTGEFDIVHSATAGATDFTVTITPKDADTIDPKQYYYVKYRTCLTGDKVPDSTDTFTNTATVNSTPVNATTKGPDFTGKKTGKINTEPKDVAGEKQPAGTTLDWNVEIPGHHLENLTDRAVITDTFSDTMTVCEVSNDLKKNLNLKVISRDFLGNNGVHAEHDLTATTTVTRTANGIDVTLPKDAGDYNRETRYYINYTLCTTSGGLDQRGTEYSNTLAYEGGPNLSSNVKQEWGGGGTGQGVSRGSFSLLKQIDSASEKFPEGTEFTVKVEEFAPGQNPATDAPYSTYNIKVKADGTPVSGVNARGTGWQVRLSEIDLPTVDGVYFEQGTFREAPGVVLNGDRTQALVTITPKSNVEVKLVNTASLGSVKITKTVIGDGMGGLTGNEAFVINAGITYGDDNAGAESRQFTLKAGQFFELKALPIGAKVTFTEVKPLNTDRVTWSEPVINPKTLTIGTDAAANTVSVTNEATITQGTFELSKKLTGPQAFNKAVPKTFDVIATWLDADDNPQSKTLTLPADGTAVPYGQNLPGGTKVTLTETVPEDGNGLAWGVPAYSGNVTIGVDGAAVVTVGKDLGKVELTNFVDTNDGTLRIAKQVSGEAAGGIGDDVEFTVEARWRDGVDYSTESLIVKQGQTTPLGVDLPVGTEVTFTETGRPDVAGVEWGTISWGTDPTGESWLITGADGTATGIVSDDPTDGRLITLSNEALWKFGSVGFTKFILDGDDRIPATEADLPDGAEFEIRIDGIDPALPAGTDFPAVGETITLGAGNDFSWTSGEVVPRGTVITFSEVDPNPLPGIDWARPYYYVAADGGEPGYRNTVQVVAGEEAVVEIHNRPIPTTDVDIDKIVTGPKGSQVTKDGSTTFQVTATWTDVDDSARSCVLDVRPGASVTPTAQCDAAVIDGRVQFPLGTEITFVETGAHTDVSNVNWEDVKWSVKDGSADVVTIDGEPTGVTVVLTGDANKPVVLGLENVTSSKGLIIIPLPIPLPPWNGGSLIPPFPGPGPDVPVINPGPNEPGDYGHNGAPGEPAPAKPDQSPSLPVTGANVIWLTGGALALIAGGAWLTLRNRRRATSEE
ncbi:DUF5979 domain-containing protein [Rhodococcus sp. (in: high G+C Gram-positive bacteria)]|uniref:DUF5979 domain-containing protein n=1 Tax=Rhodococcus sp. TaxID=1831 RepID=UPI00257EDD90|nr:DUF5979 domain-containing protein [Rhodococcus sp. (in: high G+C Gram-positive bacteria)]